MPSTMYGNKPSIYDQPSHDKIMLIVHLQLKKEGMETMLNSKGNSTNGDFF